MREDRKVAKGPTPWGAVVAPAPWAVGIGWILALALGVTAAALAGTVVGIPAAFRALNALPEAARIAEPRCDDSQLFWLSYCEIVRR